MEGVAFCPGHITGFFKAEINESAEKTGSLGAGFSIQYGVKSRVRLVEKTDVPYDIITTGFDTDNTSVSEYVLKYFINHNVINYKIQVEQHIEIPVGYGLGSSGAAALSLAFALDKVLNTRYSRERIALIAHNAEIDCKTGLGDVLGVYKGGIEIRTKPGAPGIGRVELVNDDSHKVVLICFAPIATQTFMKKLSTINGLGGKMVKRFQASRDIYHFQDMSIEFGRHAGIITKRLERVIEELRNDGIRCGVAFFGETIFTIIKESEIKQVQKIASRYDTARVITTQIDHKGPRLIEQS